MTTVQALERGRELHARKAWAESYRLLQAADRDARLEPEDLERLAIAAYLIGQDEDCESFTTRAHQRFLDRGDAEGAARAAFWLGFSLLGRGAMAPAAGWLARAGRILEEGQVDCVVRGYLLIPAAIRCVVQGDSTAADATFRHAAEIARRYGDRDLASLACHGRGRALIRLGHIAEGVALLDEAMAAVIAGDVSSLVAGNVYCSVLEGCQETFDLRRAYEWTTSLARWCASQPDLVRYRGECLLYRAEVHQLHGNWSEAARDAEDACALLMSRPPAGGAFYRLGEIHRIRGEFAEAEEAYTRAQEHGRKPQPGWALLRLAQGHTDAAAAAIQGALLDSDPQARAPRARMLAAAVEILVAARHLEHAREASAELSEIAIVFGAPLLSATSAHAAGAVHLADGDIGAASTLLRKACEIWRDLEMPYEEAHTCVLLATVCERRGDQDGRRLERETARRLFTQLSAESDLARMAEPSAQPTPQSAGPLSEREAQVLRLIAAGKTNRAIADELFISDKTVARHVSNIFDKLGVSSRSGATAWAFQHHVV